MTRQYIAPGFPFPVYVSETSTRQEIGPGVYINETVPPAPPANNEHLLLLLGVGS